MWDKVWVKPQGCVVKVFHREVSKDTPCSPGSSLKIFSKSQPQAVGQPGAEIPLTFFTTKNYPGNLS